MLRYHKELIKVLQQLKPIIRQKIDDYKSPSKLNITYKKDNSIVTALDLEISNLFRDTLHDYFPEISFFSEEDHQKLSFPTFILDPVDGTKELAEGRDDWVVSFGLYFSADFLDEKNFSWIFNPNTQEEVCSELQLNTSIKQNTAKDRILVSRTEYRHGLFENQKVEPVGSIAYKLLLLIKGEATKVISKRPKNVWDIAAGTHILLKAEYEFSSCGESIFKVQEKYEPNLIWE
jgi:myo-inositol-1(or 4)-monophosphatase